MYATLDLGIEADAPTDRGNIWSKLSIEKVISEINRRAPMKCSFMIEMASIGKPAIEIQGAELEDNRLKIHILTLGSREGKVAEELIRDEKIRLLPMIETNRAYLAADNKTYVQDITKLNKIGLETNPIIREMIGR